MTTNNSKKTSVNEFSYAARLHNANKEIDETTLVYDQWQQWADEKKDNIADTLSASRSSAKSSHQNEDSSMTNSSKETSVNEFSYAARLNNANKESDEPTLVYDQWQEWVDKKIEK